VHRKVLCENDLSAYAEQLDAVLRDDALGRCILRRLMILAVLSAGKAIAGLL